MATTKAAGQMIYLVENLSDARLRCDQLKRYLAKAMKIIEKSSKRDHFYEVAGDILNGVPEVIFKLDKALDATGLAASRLDYEELKQQLSPEKVDELEEVLEDVRVKHLERRSLPKETQVKFKAASSNRLSEALQRIASGIEDASLHPQEASNRIAFVRMALSQTAQQAVEAMGSVQANSEEAVRDGFKKSNPALTESQLDEIVQHWRDNKDVVKDRHKSAAKTFRFPEGTMTEREWVKEHADKVEEEKVDWHSLIDKKKWNRMDGEAQKEYEKMLQEKAKKPVFRAWKGDTYHDISKDTYTWAKSSLGK